MRNLEMKITNHFALYIYKNCIKNPPIMGNIFPLEIV